MNYGFNLKNTISFINIYKYYFYHLIYCTFNQIVLFFILILFNSINQTKIYYYINLCTQKKKYSSIVL